VRLERRSDFFHHYHHRPGSGTGVSGYPAGSLTLKSSETRRFPETWRQINLTSLHSFQCLRQRPMWLVWVAGALAAQYVKGTSLDYFGILIVHLASRHGPILVLRVKDRLMKLLRMCICSSTTVYSSWLTPFVSEAKAKRGEETEVDPEQFQDPDNETGLFAGTVYEQDDEEADRIYEDVDRNMDARRRARR
jgi:hypothetical protein